MHGLGQHRNRCISLSDAGCSCRDCHHGPTRNCPPAWRPALPSCRLLFWATARGLPATAGLLLSVLQAQGGSSAAAAAGVLQGALPPGQLDSLAQLHLSAQLTSAAAMQRAAEVGGGAGGGARWWAPIPGVEGPSVRAPRLLCCPGPS